MNGFRRRVLFLSLLLLCRPLLAGTPFPGTPLQIESENRQFIARIGPVAPAPDPAQPACQLRVTTAAAPEALLWEAACRFDGFNGPAGGVLSDDGSHVAQAHPRYDFGGAMVSVYHARGQWHFSGEDLGLSPPEAPDGPWLRGGLRFQPAGGAPEVLWVDTVHGERCIRLQPSPSVRRRCPGGVTPGGRIGPR